MTPPSRAHYRELLTQAYDIDKPEAPAAELAFLRDAVQRYAVVDAPTLELMSGSGRFLLPLLAEGVDVDGADASADMLAACRRHAAERGIDVDGRLHHQSAEELRLDRRYGLVFCAAGSFGLLSTDDAVAHSLAAVRDHLVPGGTFLFEVETDAARFQPDRGTLRWWQRADGAVITLRGGSRFDPTTGIEEGVGIYELYVDGTLTTTELDEWVRRFWTPDTIEQAARSAGFATVEAAPAAHVTDEGLLTVVATLHP